MIKDNKMNKKRIADKEMNISFWVDIERKKKYINTTINQEILNDNEEFDKEIIHIMERNNVPLYLKSLISEEIKNIISINRIGSIEIEKDKEDNVKYKIKLIEDFKNNTIKYNKTSFQPVFPKAYNSLINSNIPSLSDFLLSIERNYTKQIEKEWETKEKNKTEMQSIYNLKAETKTGRNLKKLMNHHNEDMELVKANYDSRIEELKNIQKKEYKFFIENLYNKLKLREDISSFEEVQGLIRSVINEYKVYLTKSNIEISSVLDNLCSSFKGELKIETKNDTEKNPIETSNVENSINQINDENKLNLSSKEKDIKIDKKVKEHNIEKIKKSKEKLNEMKSLHKNTFNSMQSINWNEAEKLITSETSDHFLPISKSFSNLNLKSSSIIGMKKLGSFFGSLKDISTQTSSSILNKFSKELEGFVDVSPLDEGLSESFTIYHGNQVRMMYNIRIMVQNFENLLRIPKNNEQQLAYFAKTATSLYSDNINGIIVLLTPSDWPKYAMGESANKTLIQQCKRTTEFHFDNIEKQLITIEKSLPKKDGKPVLNEGDFFVTCHSNLSLIHVVFHLIVSDKYNISKELISKSKCIKGYKNILSYAHKYDINNLTIPLIILPNEQINDLIEKSKRNKIISFKDSILNQYIEVLLKHTKVYMDESSRMIKYSFDSSGKEKNSRTLQFILPKIIDTDSFYNVVDQITKIFKAS
ncbi:hypothetical protein U3516DRAFT_774260 [Neocallimastix sp. 'constans']